MRQLKDNNLSRAKRGTNNPMFGKKLSEEHRAKQSASLRRFHIENPTERFKHARYGAANNKWKGGVEVVRGYKLIMAKSHPRNHRGKYFEHVIIAEQGLGRYLTNDEVVHHINHNKIDNKIENLIVVTRAWHARIHRAWENLPNWQRRAI